MRPAVRIDVGARWVTEAGWLLGAEVGGPPRAVDLDVLRAPIDLVVRSRNLTEALPDGEDLLIMDADVLYPTRLMKRLVESPHRTALLMDPTTEHVNEEMMIGVTDDRVRQLRRGLEGGEWQVTGETVGWLKIAAVDVPVLRDKVDRVIETLGVDSEYEEAYELLAVERAIGWERVDDLPWMEIDFPEDLVLAERETLPAVLELDARD